MNHCEDACEKLATQVIENMELDDLIIYAIHHMTEDYMNDIEMFL